MNDDSLDHLLAQHSDAPMPQLPGSFRQGVWREIRRRKSEPHTLTATWFGWLLEPLLKPAFAFAALTLAVVMGVGLGSGAHASQPAIGSLRALFQQPQDHALPGFRGNDRAALPDRKSVV